MQNQQVFLPAFPIKINSNYKYHSRKKSTTPPKSQDFTNFTKLLNKSSNLQKILNPQISSKILNDPDLTKKNIVSNPTLIKYQNQNNFCEINAITLTPIRLANVEISLPEFSKLNNFKSKPRKIFTAVNRRKVSEDKNSVNTSIDIPAEIITTRYSIRANSANDRLMGIKNSKDSMSKTSELFSHILIRNGTGRSAYNYSPRRGKIDRKRVVDSGSASPTVYSPIYTNNFDV
ncbi:hypothetical protein SteCoe_19932 [Stentor coeruleus]|uniref:Uncharacterized protein n=1 Tax=Stentor coeruleus TaxID=5963 RepID=A0A1R2BTF7_9CILI|nr:hypothetical protein SteCoe_19932 [Stentor coeruleus]